MAKKMMKGPKKPMMKEMQSDAKKKPVMMMKKK